MSDIAIALADTLLSGAINFLVQKQKIDLLLTTARLENREVTADELFALKAESDALFSDVMSILDEIE